MHIHNCLTFDMTELGSGYKMSVCIHDMPKNDFMTWKKETNRLYELREAIAICVWIIRYIINIKHMVQFIHSDNLQGVP